MNTKFLFDPLCDEVVTNTSELLSFLYRHFFLELVFPLFIFFAVMVTLLVDWNWIPLSTIDKSRGINVEELKRKLLG